MEVRRYPSVMLNHNPSSFARKPSDKIFARRRSAGAFLSPVERFLSRSETQAMQQIKKAPTFALPEPLQGVRGGLFGLKYYHNVLTGFLPLSNCRDLHLHAGLSAQDLSRTASDLFKTSMSRFTPLKHSQQQGHRTNFLLSSGAGSMGNLDQAGF